GTPPGAVRGRRDPGARRPGARRRDGRSAPEGVVAPALSRRSALLRQKRLHPAPGVPGGERCVVRALAEAGAGPEIRLGPPARVLLVLLHGDRRELSQAPRERHRLGQELAPRHDLDRQSGFLRLSGVERVAAQDQIEPAAHPDRVPEQLEAEDRRDPVADLRHPVARVLGRDANVGQQRQLTARAHPPAVDRGDHRHVEHPHLIVEELELPYPLLGLGSGHVLRLRQVLPGAERLVPGTRDDDGANALVRLDLRQRVGQLAFERSIERVEHARPIEGDDDNVVGPLPDDARVHARPPHRIRSSPTLARAGLETATVAPWIRSRSCWSAARATTRRSPSASSRAPPSRSPTFTIGSIVWRTASRLPASIPATGSRSCSRITPITPRYSWRSRGSASRRFPSTSICTGSGSSTSWRTPRRGRSLPTSGLRRR